MADLLSDADVGFGAAPKLLSDADVGFAPPKATAPSQSLPDAAANAAGQGLVQGVGSAIAGAGRATEAAGIHGTARQLAVMDAIDRGETVPQDQDVIGYQFMSPDQKAKAREQFAGASAELAKREPNALIRGGEAIEGAAPGMFPVAPEQEGHLTGAMRMVGGAAPALAASAIGGPAGVLGSLAVIGSQAYESTYKDAVAKGAAPEDAEDAAGKAAMAQAATMVVPVGRLLQRVPVPLRDGLMKTLVNLGQNGVEFGSANAIATFANNYVAQQTYDPARPLTQGTGEAGLEGTIAGLVIPAGAGVARGARDIGATVLDVMKAPDVDSAIAAATQAVEEPVAPAAIEGPTTPDAASAYRNAPADIPPNAKPPVLPRILDLLNEDARIAANRPDFVPPNEPQPPIPTGWGDLFAGRPPDAAIPAEGAPGAVGAAASREGTPPGLIEMAPAEAAANRAQGEIERFAAPPRPNDTTIYIPGTRPTLAEVTGDPRAAMDQAYNRQQPEAMQAHTDQENHNAEAVADYYADTAGSAQTLARMERERDERAQQNIQRVFGDPQSTRAPADPTDVIQFMDSTLSDPRMQERDIIRKTLPNLIDRFYNDDGSVKTDPLSLYGIRQHIQDLLNGAGDPETNAAARMLRRELMQIQARLDDAIEQAAPGFGQYRADYANDSRAIDAMKLLQDERLPLLNKDLHITPAKWFTFMKGIIEGRTDPMDPASSLSEEQMDRLWNITDQLKRQTFIDAGKPRGSWTSMMQEFGGNFAKTAANLAVASHFPIVGNMGVKLGTDFLRRRSVNKEMNRVLNPDLGQQVSP